jgi:hypothetical protein
MKQRINKIYKSFCNKKEQTKDLFIKNFTGNENVDDGTKLKLVNKIIKKIYGIFVHRYGTHHNRNYKLSLIPQFKFENNRIKVNKI